MADRAQYLPGPANLAHVQKERLPNGEEKWTLVLVRELRHPPERVWEALTDPAHLREWAPFDADVNLGTKGNTVKLTTVGAPAARITETTVKRAEAPEFLEYNWGGFDMRWKLEPVANGTRLTLWTNIGHRFIAMGAAGWHVCFDVLDRHLEGHPIGRIAGPVAMNFDGWRRLNAEYAKQFGIEAPDWPPKPSYES
ncbi:MAG TPA: SRPBCC domain-containing protein [Verrucomicrobiae bacterium]|nr:SRPBCC domain-containing protein [Verrucomicrobiae bacterium]